MIELQMVLTCDNREMEDTLWNEVQDNLGDLEIEIAYAVSVFTSETIYKGTPMHLIPGWEVRLKIDEAK